MIIFHEGQDVEVAIPNKRAWSFGDPPRWRKAKIVESHSIEGVAPNKDYYSVQFPDRTRAVFDTDHIRPAREVYRGQSGATVEIL